MSGACPQEEPARPATCNSLPASDATRFSGSSATNARVNAAGSALAGAPRAFFRFARIARLDSIALAVGGALSCGSPPPPAPAKQPVAVEGVARYLPLEHDTVFSYVTRMEPGGEQGLLVLEVRRRRPELAELVVAGRAQRLNVSSNSIELVTGGALLRAPLTLGASWRGDFGRVRVTNLSKGVTVPAGAFSDCLETVEEMTSAEGTKRTSTVYCPGVGIALRETEVEQDGAHATDRIELKSFGKRFVAGGP